MPSHRIIAAAAALALAAAPASMAKKPADAGATGKAKSEQHKGKGKAKAKNVVVQGTIVSVDLVAGTATVKVTKANKHGRDLTELVLTVAKVSVADVNEDGDMTLADFGVGDRVVAHTKGGKLISVTNPEPEEAEETETPAPAPTTTQAPTA